ncbi:hypothetical protein [uncultured Campylobacter sp.]|uniref:hypothetical protein n=1 Tax=uncultured Campylobacter sp. TaxID=218934 RepID=UPI00260CF6E5|nr:hypothetical protein [uncultured Campylobacter sp.]
MARQDNIKFKNSGFCAAKFKFGTENLQNLHLPVLARAGGFTCGKSVNLESKFKRPCPAFAARDAHK